MSSPDDELRRLRGQLARMTEEAANNEAILRRSRERELALLNAENLPELFRRLTGGLRESFDLPHVSVLLCDPDHEVRHLLIAAGTGPEELPDVALVDALTGIAPHYTTLRGPWLGPYSAADHQLIFGRGTAPASIALIPLERQGRLMGSLNFGSADPGRYTRSHGTEFLGHLGVIASFALENAVNRARLLRSGITDVLTGWHNRRYLQTRLREELARARRDGSPLTLLLIDIDHFKRVNDNHGHLAGDLVLTEVAQRIESRIRASDVAARYGGEEFVLLLPDTDAVPGRSLAERLRAAVAERPVALADGTELALTISAGLATVTPSRADEDLKTLAESLLARADVALYEAKSAGRDRVAASG
ncbi:GGDEF domain-containing protein [Lentisalinibacter orientalis]|uniref:GGDEF domain-containing protein n=1 Tax=Lentisalinibacter orientalis TaxID=2992241 RepID=UPI00386ADF16